MTRLLLLLLPVAAWAQEAPPPPAQPPARALPVPAESAALPEAAPAAMPTDGAPGPDAPTEAPAGDTGSAEEPVPEAAPRPWEPLPPDQRSLDGMPLVGPWPDSWAPERTGQEGLPEVDPLLGDVLDPGTPYASGPELGPQPPVEMLGPVSGDAVAPEPGVLPDSLAPKTGPAPTAAPAPSPPVAAPAPAPVAPELLAETTRRSLAEDFLPPPPRSGSHRFLGFLALAALAFLLSTFTERLGDKVRGSGLIPRLLSMLTGVGRGLTVPFLLVAMLSMLPRSWSLAVPFALVALAVSLGWTARDLLADIFAGIVLTVERRIRPGERLEFAEHRGVVNGLGVRSTRLTVDDGRMVSIPNRRLLLDELRIDPDGYAPVVVPVPVHPHLSVGEVRQILQELALLSPYIAPSRPPNVYRDADRRDVWIVEARLVHPRFANAFRGALVELADEQFAADAEKQAAARRLDGPDGRRG